VPLRRAALQLGPQEYVALMTLGLAAAVIGTGRSFRSPVAVALGLAIGPIGLDLNGEAARFTFGVTGFDDGLQWRSASSACRRSSPVPAAPAAPRRLRAHLRSRGRADLHHRHVHAEPLGTL